MGETTYLLSLTLKQQTLEAEYELNKIRKSYALEKEEYTMGIRSKAQLEVSEDEFNYKTASTRLKLQSLRSDSAMTVINCFGMTWNGNIRRWNGVRIG